MALGRTIVLAVCCLIAAPALADPPAPGAEAAYRLGLRADLGQGMPEDAREAYHWYRQAAEAGLPEAAFNVAVMEDSGRGVAHDAADAATWYARAAARGNARAQYDLGLLYASGDGVPRNPAAARAWFRLALAHGLAAAAEKLRPAAQPVAAAVGAAPQAAIPVAPGAHVVVRTAADGSVVFVWRAPPQNGDVRYFLQVVTRDGGAPREIAASYADATAALVHPGTAAGYCFWRVFTVAPERYVTTPWVAFSLRGPA